MADDTQDTDDTRDTAEHPTMQRDRLAEFEKLNEEHATCFATTGVTPLAVVTAFLVDDGDGLQVAVHVSEQGKSFAKDPDNQIAMAVALFRAAQVIIGK